MFIAYKAGMLEISTSDCLTSGSQIFSVSCIASNITEISVGIRTGHNTACRKMVFDLNKNISLKRTERWIRYPITQKTSPQEKLPNPLLSYIMNKYFYSLGRTGTLQKGFNHNFIG